MALQLFKIASVEIATPQTSIDFSSIPSGYTDLILKLSAREATTTSLTLYLTINGSTSAIYSVRTIQGNGTTASSGIATNGTSGNFSIINSSSYTNNTFSNAEFYIPNYAGSNNKSLSIDSVSENNGTEAYARLAAGIWASTAAINQLTLSLASGNIAAGSTATLYGVL